MAGAKAAAVARREAKTADFILTLFFGRIVNTQLLNVESFLTSKQKPFGGSWVAPA